MLRYKNESAAKHFVHLQNDDSRAYLSHVRLTRGFAHYVGEFSKVHHYSSWQQDAPPFLVGRWALFKEAKRVSENYFPEVCVNAVEIEDGRFKHLDHKTQVHRARYRIDHGKVVVEIDGKASVPITLASYGTALHHIEVQLPGDQHKRYGYLCK